MTLPLGVLALGAVFAGMIWYGDFFGDPAKVTKFFNLAPEAEHATEAPAAATTEAPAATAATTEAVTTTTTTEAATATATEPAATTVATTEAAPATPAATATEVAVAPQGAIYMGADNHVMELAHEAPDWVKTAPFVAMLIGFATAWMFYIRNPSLPGRWAAAQPVLYRFILNKWYFDEIYEVLFVRSAKALGRFLWVRGDGNAIDGTINGVAMGVVPFFTRLAGRAQSGYLFHYAFAMVLGIAGLLLWMTLSGGAQ